MPRRLTVEPCISLKTRTDELQRLQAEIDVSYRRSDECYACFIRPDTPPRRIRPEVGRRRLRESDRVCPRREVVEAVAASIIGLDPGDLIPSSNRETLMIRMPFSSGWRRPSMFESSQISPRFDNPAAFAGAPACTATKTTAAANKILAAIAVRRRIFHYLQRSRCFLPGTASRRKRPSSGYG